MLRLAVLGAGLIGREHIARIAGSPEASLAAVVDPSPAAAAIAAAHTAPWYPDFATMLAAVRPDGVIVATPNQMHRDHGLAVIAAGIPVLVEKPIADTLEAAEALVTAAEATGVPLLVGHHRRHSKMIRRARAIIESGQLGRIVAVHGFFWLVKPDAYFDVAWRREPGAGPVLLNLIHDIDLLRHFCGEVASVQAFGSNAVRGFPVDDSCVVSLRFTSGALGTITVSDTIPAPWSWEQTAGENPAYPRTGEACYQIGGTLGALSIPSLELWSSESERSWWQPLQRSRVYDTDADPLVEQIAQFCRVIRGAEPPLVPGREGLASLRVIHAIQQAAATGQRVDLLPG